MSGAVLHSSICFMTCTGTTLLPLQLFNLVLKFFKFLMEVNKNFRASAILEMYVLRTLFHECTHLLVEKYALPAVYLQISNNFRKRFGVIALFGIFVT